MSNSRNQDLPTSRLECRFRFPTARRLETNCPSCYLVSMCPDEPFEYPIDGSLDLHQFQPSEVKTVVETYIEECRKRGILAIRIIHGKGIGVQREIVRSILSKHPHVAGFRHEEGSGGGWGATVVDLKK